jgi:hypothetical protein
MYLLLGEHDRGLPQVDQNQRQQSQYSNVIGQILIDVILDVSFLINGGDFIRQKICVCGCLLLQDSVVDQSIGSNHAPVESPFVEIQVDTFVLRQFESRGRPVCPL